MSSIKDDIVWQLRHPEAQELAKLLKRAADEIERLRESVEWLYKN